MVSGSLNKLFMAGKRLRMIAVGFDVKQLAIDQGAIDNIAL